MLHPEGSRERTVSKLRGSDGSNNPRRYRTIVGLVAGMLPGIERQPRKKLEPSAERLLGLLHRWRDEAVKAGRKIRRIALAFEGGRAGCWLPLCLEARGVEAHVIHASSVAVSRDHRRAKTDRLDTELLKRGFLGWLRGERGHCTMARVPTIAEEDAKRP